MNKRQRTLLTQISAIFVVTIFFVIAMIYYKDVLNRREGIRAMNILSKEIASYRLTVGSLPPKSYIDQIASQYNFTRLGNYECRSLWIELDSPPETILLYSKREDGMMLVKPGYITLSLGDIEESERILTMKEEIAQLTKKLGSLQGKELIEASREIKSLEKQLRELTEKGLTGDAQWLPKAVFEQILKKQQSQAEAEIFLKSD